ncbi:DUF759 family protein (plasmid) [Borreliella californiensis]|uniref:Uncharacterized protein n=1 Tax=Borreliella californiensis TaxID=373543 RepID=A0A7W9ZN01_9SPIR|nr:hypothetical protein [Borreliella californiensis]
MSDKFTIKFKGILDHAATKKAIEQDISKMGKYLKPKKSSLGSTKDIVKNNLSDKKKELSRQSKFESLRERVEKYRLTQTKKLMKQGRGFEKARKEAFRRSLMSDRDKRHLEYKELAKESKAKSKMIAASQGKGLVAKIAIGSALGNVIGNAVSRVGGGIFGFAFGWIKKSVEAISKKEKAQKLNTAFYTTEQRKILMGNEEENIKGIFQEKKGFAGEKEKIDSNLINLEQSLMNVTAAGMQPVLEGASEIIEWIKDIMKTYKKGGITGVIGRIITNMLSSIGASINAWWQSWLNSLPPTAKKALRFFKII